MATIDELLTHTQGRHRVGRNVAFRPHAAAGSGAKRLLMEQGRSLGSHLARHMTTSRPPPPAIVAGTILADRYRVQSLLGEGGMGAVYLVEHVHMRKRFALKVLHANVAGHAEIVARFKREAMAAAHIDHPNVAAATDFGETADGAFFLVLEHVEGSSLREAMKAGPIVTARALSIVRQVASGLARAHDLGIVHRDLKPENIMLVRKGSEGDFVKVLDFGIARVPIDTFAKAGTAASAPLTRMGAIFGTPEYMAPEQALGETTDARADLYALGVILYEMLTGVLPFEAEDAVGILAKQITQSAPAMSLRAPDVSIPHEVEALTRRLLEKKPEDRPGSARDLVDAVDHVARVHGVPLSLTPRMSLDAGWSASLHTVKTNARLFAGGGVSLLLGIFLVAHALSSTDRASRDPVEVALTPEPPRSGGTALRLPSRVAVQGDPRALRETLLAQTAAGRHEDAMRTLATLVVVDPSVVDDARVRPSLLAALAGDADASDLALSTLEGPFGAQGVDVMIESLSSKEGAKTKAKIRSALTRPDVRAHASPAAAVWIDLKEARSCAAKRELLSRAREDGDERLLPALQTLKQSRGCGFLGARDCWSCMRDDDALNETIAAIEARRR